METTDIITIVFAIYGAGLATILGYRELKKESRSIRLVLEYEFFTEIYRLKISNKGQRPVIITEIHADITQYEDGKRKYTERVPFGDIFEEPHDREEIPFRLEDGDRREFVLSRMMAEFKLDQDKKIEISVTDTDGQTWKTNKQWSYNPRMGDRGLDYDSLSIFQKLKGKFNFHHSNYRYLPYRMLHRGKYPWEVEKEKFEKMDRDAKG